METLQINRVLRTENEQLRTENVNLRRMYAYLRNKWNALVATMSANRQLIQRQANVSSALKPIGNPAAQPESNQRNGAVREFGEGDVRFIQKLLNAGAAEGGNRGSGYQRRGVSCTMVRENQRTVSCVINLDEDESGEDNGCVNDRQQVLASGGVNHDQVSSLSLGTISSGDATDRRFVPRVGNKENAAPVAGNTSLDDGQAEVLMEYVIGCDALEMDNNNSIGNVVPGPNNAPIADPAPGPYAHNVNNREKSQSIVGEVTKDNLPGRVQSTVNPISSDANTNPNHNHNQSVSTTRKKNESSKKLPAKLFPCHWSGCGEIFGLKIALNQHAKLHGSENFHSCPKCEKSFFWKDSTEKTHCTPTQTVG